MKDSHADRALRHTLASGSQEAPGACPDDNELAAYLEKRLSPMETARLEKHVSRCKDCQPILALSLILAEPATAPDAPAATALSRSLYRAPLVRLAFAVIVVFGTALFLFRLTRDWQPLQPNPQMAPRVSSSNLSGGRASSLRASGNSPAGGGVATSPRNEAPPKVASIPAEPKSAGPPDKSARPNRNVLVAPGPPPILDAISEAPLRVADRDKGVKPAVSDAREELLKSQRAQADLQALPWRITAARPAEARLQAAGTGNQNPAAAVAVGGIEAAKAKDAKSDTTSEGDRVRQALSEVRLVLGKGAPADTRTIGERVFCLIPGYWVDIECARHEEAPIVRIARGSKDYADLLTKDPSLEGLPTTTPILLYLNGVMALIR